MSNYVQNQVIKIDTPNTLGYTLSHNGGIENVDEKVVNCSMVEISQIE